jgi:hypothetical protein
MKIYTKIYDELDDVTPEKTGKKTVLVEIEHYQTFSTETEAKEYAAKAQKVLEKAKKKL